LPISTKLFHNLQRIFPALQIASLCLFVFHLQKQNFHINLKNKEITQTFSNN
jgi:hypothetical protein